MRLLLLEDDEAIGIGLTYSLEKEGYDVTWVKCVREALQRLAQETFDAYILDLTLPDGSGYDVCRRIRELGDSPVLFLSAFDDEVNVVMGLELGADDYISKPFRVRELLARLKTVMRRCRKNGADGVLHLGNVEIHTNEAKVYKKGEELLLTAMEYRLLLVLLNNRGQVLSRAQLLEHMWDVDGEFVNDNTLTVYVKRLRNKIEEDPANPVYIQTVRGMGYRIDNAK